MWAQLMRFRLKPGKDTAGLREQLQAVEQPGSGLLRTMIMQDQRNADQFCTLVVFESEEKARARARPASPGGVAGPPGDAGRQARGSAGVHRSGRRRGVDRVDARPVQQPRAATHPPFGCSRQASTYAPPRVSAIADTAGTLTRHLLPE